MLVKAIVRSNSSEDPEGLGRVVVESPGIWEVSDYFPVLDGVPLNEGDPVYVEVSDSYGDALVLGKSVDKSFSSHGSSLGSGFSVLWESVYDGGWTVCYVRGDDLWIENSDPTKGSIHLTGSDCIINGGSNGGVVNVGPLRDCIVAVLQDLLNVGSGLNLIEWMGKAMGVGSSEIEDPHFKH